MPVVTICGRLGAGAREIGGLAAQRLGIDYVDQQILVEAARTLGVSVDQVESRDERASTLRDRLSGMLRTFLERSAWATTPDAGGGLEQLLSRSYGEAAELPQGQHHELNEKLYIDTLTSIIRTLGERGNTVILGRGSQIMLRDLPQITHVLCLAPAEYRASETARLYGFPPDEALRRSHESDRNRLAFHHKYFKVDPDNPELYDLVIRTDRYSAEGAAAVVAEAVRRRVTTTP